MNPDQDRAEPPRQEGRHDDGVEAAALARLAVSAGLRTTGWALRTSLRSWRRLGEAAVSPAKAAQLAREVGNAAGVIARELNDLVDVDGIRGAAPAAGVAKKVAEAMPSRADGSASAEAASDGVPQRQRSLREEGEQLLRMSRDVRLEFEAHPAYERILSELAPDEARILRLLMIEGPQPAVDIRTGGPLGLIRSRLIAPGKNMIGARAGCRYVERVPSYLNNLFRLGMVWFSRETLRDPSRYQVLEAQPEVLEAIHSVSQAKVVRRSIHLTPFGEDLCRICLCSEQTAPDSLPPHAIPSASTAAPRPPTELGQD